MFTEEIAGTLGVPPAVALVLLALAALLAGSTLLRGLFLLLRPGGEIRKRWRSLATWWALLALLVLVLAAGRGAVWVLVVAASLLLLRESLTVLALSRFYPVCVALAAGVYLWAWWYGPSLFLVAAPVVAGVLLLGERVRSLVLRKPPGPASWLALAFFLSVVGPSYLLGLVRLPARDSVAVAWPGLLLSLLVLTQVNDIAQALWGRAVGSRRLAPELSPGKTWEGFIGGLATTVLAAMVLLPLLTPLGRPGSGATGEAFPPLAEAAFTGFLLSLAGLAGDLTASLVKRKGGVKDAGDLLPGHGGLLDRFDSLAFTAPVFFMAAYILGGAS